VCILAQYQSIIAFKVYTVIRHQYLEFHRYICDTNYIDSKKEKKKEREKEREKERKRERKRAREREREREGRS